MASHRATLMLQHLPYSLSEKPLQCMNGTYLATSKYRQRDWREERGWESLLPKRSLGEVFERRPFVYYRIWPYKAKCVPRFCGRSCETLQTSTLKILVVAPSLRFQLGPDVLRWLHTATDSLSLSLIMRSATISTFCCIPPNYQILNPHEDDKVAELDDDGNLYASVDS